MELLLVIMVRCRDDEKVKLVGRWMALEYEAFVWKVTEGDVDGQFAWKIGNDCVFVWRLNLF